MWWLVLVIIAPTLFSLLLWFIAEGSLKRFIKRNLIVQIIWGSIVVFILLSTLSLSVLLPLVLGGTENLNDLTYLHLTVTMSLIAIVNAFAVFVVFSELIYLVTQRSNINSVYLLRLVYFLGILLQISFLAEGFWFPIIGVYLPIQITPVDLSILTLLFVNPATYFLLNLIESSLIKR